MGSQSCRNLIKIFCTLNGKNHRVKMGPSTNDFNFYILWELNQCWFAWHWNFGWELKSNSHPLLERCGPIWVRQRGLPIYIHSRYMGLPFKGGGGPSALSLWVLCILDDRLAAAAVVAVVASSANWSLSSSSSSPPPPFWVVIQWCY